MRMSMAYMVKGLASFFGFYHCFEGSQFLRVVLSLRSYPLFNNNKLLNRKTGILSIETGLPQSGKNFFARSLMISFEYQSIKAWTCSIYSCLCRSIHFVKSFDSVFSFDFISLWDWLIGSQLMNLWNLPNPTKLSSVLSSVHIIFSSIQLPHFCLSFFEF